MDNIRAPQSQESGVPASNGSKRPTTTSRSRQLDGNDSGYPARTSPDPGCTSARTAPASAQDAGNITEQAVAHGSAAGSMSGPGAMPVPVDTTPFPMPSPVSCVINGWPALLCMEQYCDARHQQMLIMARTSTSSTTTARGMSSTVGLATSTATISWAYTSEAGHHAQPFRLLMHSADKSRLSALQAAAEQQRMIRTLQAQASAASHPTAPTSSATGNTKTARLTAAPTAAPITAKGKEEPEDVEMGGTKPVQHDDASRKHSGIGTTSNIALLPTSMAQERTGTSTSPSTRDVAAGAIAHWPSAPSRVHAGGGASPPVITLPIKHSSSIAPASFLRGLLFSANANQGWQGAQPVSRAEVRPGASPTDKTSPPA